MARKRFSSGQQPPRAEAPTDGDCTFLGPQGCTLPLEVRPLVCRLYPYDYSQRGIRDELAPGCPLKLLRPGQGLIDEFDMNLDEARRWHQQLYEEIRLEKTAVIDQAMSASTDQ